MLRPTLAAAAAVALSLLSSPALAQQDDAVREVIRRHVEQIRTVGELSVGDSPISSVLVLPDLYERRSFAPAWTDEAAVSDLLRAIDDIEGDGLDPNDYHRTALLERRELLRGGQATTEEVADFDMLLTDALVRLGYHILFGKVDPERLDPSWNMATELGHLEPVSVVQGAIESGRLYEVVEGYKPIDPFYVQLKVALVRYRAYAAEGGWDPVPAVRRLELDSVDARVPALRSRLAATDDLPESASLTSEAFDADVDAAVRTFQRRHGLTADGIVGANTVAAMNVPVEDRIRQIRVNLERGRWILRDLGDDFVIVNIAGFRTYLVRDREVVWETRSVVGRTYRKTPVFRADMKYLVFNPTWTVPPGILRNDILPALQRDPGYLADHDMVLLDRAGNAVDTSQLDYNQYAAGNFPYIVRQNPGPTNSLGLVKFIFPNEHFVFLHDTPSRALFDREVRMFSSGCIRVENPFELVEMLLGSESWNRPAIDRTLATKDTRTVHLDTPLPVVVMYWTAWIDLEGQLTFYPDVYERDAAVAAGLEEDFRFRDRAIVPGEGD